jgi:hypothetical protein
MIINMAATTTAGTSLMEEELTKVFEACDMILELEQIKNKVPKYSFIVADHVLC